MGEIQVAFGVLHGSGNSFSLNKQEKDSIAELIGLEWVKKIELIGNVYLVEKQHFRKLSNVPERNEKLQQIRDHIAELTELLSDKDTKMFLLSTMGEMFGSDEVPRTLLENSSSISHPSLIFMNDLRLIDVVCRASLPEEQPRAGRPKGTYDKAVHNLLEQLYWLCLQASGERLTTKSGNQLQLLVDVLNRPLGLGGNLPGLVRKVIDDHNKKQNTP